MPYMSYHRFRSTLSELRECVTALEELQNDPTVEMSVRECEAAYEMVDSMIDYITLLDESNELPIAARGRLRKLAR